MLRTLDDHDYIAAATGCDLLAVLADGMAEAFNDRGNMEGPKFHALALELRQKARAYREAQPAVSRPEASTG